MKRVDLVSIIEDAFKGVTQPKSITLHVAQAHDDYDYLNNSKHRKNDYIGDWNNVPSEHLAKCRDALSYLDAEGIRFYLPAYMVWVLKDFGKHDIDDFVLYALDNSPNNKELNDYFKKRFSLLDSKQMRACALFVKYCAEEDPEDLIDVSFARKKFDRFWYQYI
jgi:hypothetical protein